MLCSCGSVLSGADEDESIRLLSCILWASRRVKLIRKIRNLSAGMYSGTVLPFCSFLALKTWFACITNYLTISVPHKSAIILTACFFVACCRSRESNLITENSLGAVTCTAHGTKQARSCCVFLWQRTACYRSITKKILFRNSQNWSHMCMRASETTSLREITAVSQRSFQGRASSLTCVSARETMSLREPTAES